MMNVPPHSCNELSYLPPNPPPPTLPIMDQERPEQLGYNLLEANGNMSISNPLALLPSNTSLQHHTQAAHHDILQIYPTSSSHYLSNPYGTHFPGPGSTSFQYSYYPSVPTAPEYHLPSLVAPPAAEDNMASTQLGLNLGYRTYFPPRGGYAYGHHLPRCQAEGCKADLSSAKRYHRRHRVCEHHSKAPLVVTAGGLHQRFCQQCSRFHLLDEFDDTKKSCRKRLADHNRRRRKSKPSDVDAATDKKRTQASKATTKEAGSSGKSTTIGAAVEQQVVASAHLRKEQHHQTTSLGVQVVGDHKWKASMQQAAPHASLYHRNHHGFSFPSSSGTCFPQSQVVSSDNTSTIAQEHEPSLAFHQLHNHRNVLQLGQAMFDLDFTN